MKLAAALLAFFLVSFLIVEAVGVPVLADDDVSLGTGGALAAAAGLGLLVGDVLLPVPSSVVMATLGALFGTFGGVALSWAGGVGATLVGVLIGRRGGRLLDRLSPEGAGGRAERLLRRYGTVAIILTRPVPMLAETVAVMAGRSGLQWRRAVPAAIVGALLPAVLYGASGSALHDGDRPARERAGSLTGHEDGSSPSAIRTRAGGRAGMVDEPRRAGA